MKSYVSFFVTLSVIFFAPLINANDDKTTLQDLVGVWENTEEPVTYAYMADGRFELTVGDNQTDRGQCDGFTRTADNAVSDVDFVLACKGVGRSNLHMMTTFLRFLDKDHIEVRTSGEQFITLTRKK